MYKPVQIEDALRNKIFGSMELVVSEVFINYFGAEIKSNTSPPSKEEASNKKKCMCEVKMEHGNIEMFVCFDFDADLLFRLVDETYAGEDVSDLKPYSDAACEIANIVCCRIKSILNGNGYKFDMKIPEPVDNQDKFNDIPYTLNMRFLATTGGGFVVNLYTIKQG